MTTKIKLGPDTPVRRFSVGAVEGRTLDSGRLEIKKDGKDISVRYSGTYWPLRLTKAEARGVVQGLGHLLKTKGQKLEVVDPTDAEVQQLKQKLTTLQSHTDVLENSRDFWIKQSEAYRDRYFELLGENDIRLRHWGGWLLALGLGVWRLVEALV